MNDPLLFNGVGLETVCERCQGTGQEPRLAFIAHCSSCGGDGLVLSRAAQELLTFLGRYLEIELNVRKR